MPSQECDSCFWFALMSLILWVWICKRLSVLNFPRRSVFLFSGGWEGVVGIFESRHSFWFFNFLWYQYLHYWTKYKKVDLYDCVTDLWNINKSLSIKHDRRYISETTQLWYLWWVTLTHKYVDIIRTMFIGNTDLILSTLVITKIIQCVNLLFFRINIIQCTLEMFYWTL